MVYKKSKNIYDNGNKTVILLWPLFLRVGNSYMYTIIQVVNTTDKIRAYNININLPTENTTFSDMDFEYSFYIIQGESKVWIHPVRF